MRKLFLFFYILPALCLLFPPPASAADPEPPQLKVVTYNVLASRENWGWRVPALLKILEESKADIIALQEVTPDFVKNLKAQEWTKTYRFAGGSKDSEPIEFVILSRFPIVKEELLSLPGPQERKALVVHFNVGPRRLAVANCHLESLLEDGPVRAKQLDVIFEALKDAQDLMLIGDFNSAPNDMPEAAHLQPGFLDAWYITNPDKNGYTWDIAANPMAKAGSFANELSRRLDRILLKSDYWVPASAGLLGDNPIDPRQPEQYPSDHFGVEATLRIKP